jgi:hypothetical protein
MRSIIPVCLCSRAAAVCAFSVHPRAATPRSGKASRDVTKTPEVPPFLTQSLVLFLFLILLYIYKQQAVLFNPQPSLLQTSRSIHVIVAFHARSKDYTAVRSTIVGGCEGEGERPIAAFKMVKRRSRGPPKLPAKQLAILGEFSTFSSTFIVDIPTIWRGNNFVCCWQPSGAKVDMYFQDEGQIRRSKEAVFTVLSDKTGIPTEFLEI